VTPTGADPPVRWDAAAAANPATRGNDLPPTAPRSKELGPGVADLEMNRLFFPGVLRRIADRFL
jgi:hypothetical protein